MNILLKYFSFYCKCDPCDCPPTLAAIEEERLLFKEIIDKRDGKQLIKLTTSQLTRLSLIYASKNSDDSENFCKIINALIKKRSKAKNTSQKIEVASCNIL